MFGKRGFVAVLGVLIMHMFVVGGCIARVESVATRPSLLQKYERLAILGLDESDEAFFITEYMKRFPLKMFVERRDLQAILSEQDLRPGRLSDETRAKIRRVHGVEAIILANIKGQELTARIVDAENGLIVASTVIEGRNYWDRTPNDKQMIRKAVEALLVGN